VAVITASSLYVSSMCRSGVRALVLSLPVAVAVLLFVQALTTTLMRVMFDPNLFGRLHVLSGASWAIAPAIEAGLVGLLLWFAFVNHRSADQSARRVALQVASLAAFVTVGIALSFLA
jgi:hypothetical protein